MYKALGAINKVNTGSKKKADSTKAKTAAKSAKSASAKTATAVVVED